MTRRCELAGGSPAPGPATSRTCTTTWACSCFKQAARDQVFDPAQVEQAIAHLRDTLELDPERIEARERTWPGPWSSGPVRTRPKRQFEAGSRDATRIADVHFRSWPTCSWPSDDLPGAARALEAAVRLQPDYLEALQNLGAVYLENG